MAFENNARLRLARVGVDDARERVRQSEGLFVPRLLGELRGTTAHDPGGPLRFESIDSQVALGLAVFGKAPTGLEYRLGLDTLLEHYDNRWVAVYRELGRTDLRVLLTQPLLRGGGLLVNRAPLIIASMNETVSRELCQAEAENVLAEVELAYFGLAMAEQEREIRRATVALAQQLVERARARLKLDSVAELDVLEAEAALARRREEVEASTLEMVELRGRLLHVLQPRGEQPGAELGSELVLTDEPTVHGELADLPELVRRALSHRADLRAARAQIDVEAVTEEVESNRLWPSIDLFANVGLSGFGGTLASNQTTGSLQIAPDPALGGGASTMYQNLRFWSAGVGLRVEAPLDNRQARAQLALQHNLVERRRVTADALEREIGYQVSTARSRLLSDLERVKMLETSAALAQRLLEGQQKRYERGVAVSFDVLRATDESNRARLLLQRARVTAHLSRARLLLSQGIYLEERGLRLDESLGETKDGHVR